LPFRVGKFCHSYPSGLSNCGPAPVLSGRMARARRKLHREAKSARGRLSVGGAPERTRYSTSRSEFRTLCLGACGASDLTLQLTTDHRRLPGRLIPAP
jgi:hypothetical protein